MGGGRVFAESDSRPTFAEDDGLESSMHTITRRSQFSVFLYLDRYSRAFTAAAVQYLLFLQGDAAEIPASKFHGLGSDMYTPSPSLLLLISGKTW